jgi:type III pantothenate kinase
MLLVIDTGNTNTVLGVYDGKKLIANWRLETKPHQTADEYGILTRNLFALAGLESTGIHDIIISSVVPPLNSTLEQMAFKYFNLKPLFVEPGIKTGMPVLYDSPSEVGADRIVNAVAAFEKFGGPAIVVDFGTATTFDAISARGEYLGGLIAPGLAISAEALYARTARLPRVEIKAPPKVIGTSTVGSMQAGLYYGYIGLIDGILERMLKELGAKSVVIATGGFATLIGRETHLIQQIDQDLTLEGLRLVYERNRPR